MCCLWIVASKKITSLNVERSQNAEPLPNPVVMQRRSHSGIFKSSVDFLNSFVLPSGRDIPTSKRKNLEFWRQCRRLNGIEFQIPQDSLLDLELNLKSSPGASISPGKISFEQVCVCGFSTMQVQVPSANMETDFVFVFYLCLDRSFLTIFLSYSQAFRKWVKN